MTTVPLAGRRIHFKPLHLIGIAIILLAVGLAYNGLSQSFRPYTTTISEATNGGRGVQLAGFLGNTGEYDAAGNFTFLLQDNTGNLVKVVYAQPKPSNFEQAVSVVAIGHYDAAQQVFIAEDLLVKCPSKYQEMQASSS